MSELTPSTSSLPSLGPRERDGGSMETYGDASSMHTRSGLGVGLRVVDCWWVGIGGGSFKVSGGLAMIHGEGKRRNEDGTFCFCLSGMYVESNNSHL